MIKRKIPKTVAPAESLKEHSFTASRGINVTTAPTIRDDIYDSTNLQLNLDGSMSIRKPLVFSKDFKSFGTPTNGKLIFSEYLFDNKTLFQIHEQPNGNLKMFYLRDGALKIFNIYNSDKKELGSSLDNVFKKDAINLIHTVNSTIISGVLVDLKNFAKGTYNSTINSEMLENYKPRYLKIYKKEDSENIFEMMFVEPDIPSISVSDTISINYNTISDYVYSLRDNYKAQAISVSGILPYIKNTTDELSSVTVEELTESDKFYTFTTLADTKSYSTYILKAFMNIKEDLKEGSKYCCTWEKTYDGITWQNVPEFINAFNTFDLNIKDNTYLNESLENSSDYTRIVKHTFLNTINSIEDVITNRPDILILNTLDSATYRFTIRMIHDASLITFKNPKVTRDNILIETIGNTVNYNWTIEYELNTETNLDLEDVTFEYKFNETYTKITKNRLGILGLSPTVSKEVVSKNGFKFLKIILNFASLGLEQSFQMQGLYFDYCLKYKGAIKHESRDRIAIANLYDYKITSLDGESPNLKIAETLETSDEWSANLIFDDTIDIDMLKKMLPKSEPSDTDFLKPKTYRLQSISFEVWVKSDIVKNFIKNYPYSKTTSYVDGILQKEFIPSAIDVYYGANHIYTFKEKSLYIDYTEDSNGISPSFYIPITLTPSDREFDTFITTTWYQNTSLSDTPEYKQMFICTQRNALLSEVFLDFMEYKNRRFTNTSINTLTLGQLINIDFDNPPAELLQDYAKLYYDNAYTINYSFNKDEVPFDFENISDTEFFANSDYFDLGLANWNLIKSNATELLNTKIPNTVGGNKLYYNHRIYTYGKNYKNCIYATDVDSFTTPLFNVIDLNTDSDTYVTTLIPWRNYLLAATENSIFLIQETTNGFTSKVINTYIGIPEKDSKTCKAILNGIVFKSGNCIYSLQPSAYSTDDSILNIVEISKPVANYVLDGNYQNFALTTEQAYYMFVPGSETLCLRYEFLRKVWTKYVYPIHIKDFHMTSVDNILVHSDDFIEYTFEKDYQTVYEYGDYLSFKIEDGEYIPNITPIQFMLDSGQKTDDLSRTKQFVESKFILATLNDKDTFPLSIDVLIDGLEYKQLHFDASTDAAFIKESSKDILTFNASIGNNSQNIFNVMRQMVIRYSGKGKSIKHIIYGKSIFNFKFYVLYYKYKNTHLK